MIFELNFEYRENVEYYLNTYSNWFLEGYGTWEVDADDLIGEIDFSKFDSIEDAIKDYLYMDLDKDPDYIKFNKEDMEALIKYVQEYEN